MRTAKSRPHVCQEHTWLVSTAHRIFVFMCHKLMSSFVPKGIRSVFSAILTFRGSAVILNCHVTVVDTRRVLGTIEKAFW